MTKKHDGSLRALALDEELALECGGARDHEDALPIDEPTRAALRILDTARIDVERGELHPTKVRERLEEPLRALEPKRERRGRSLASIVAGWRDEGRLEHVPTGIPAIDDATAGGPVLGTRWIVQGAPDAGKTALGVQIADDLARAGRIVGILAVDEEPDDIATRLAQRAGFSREECEAREPHILEQIEAQLRELGLEVYDREWTIEGAADDVARRAKERGAVGVLLIDSLQTVRCERERAELEGGRELPIAAAVDARVKAIRACAIEHRLIVIATSEMNRSGYRSQKAAAADDDPLASAKWSGAIEYAARVLLSLRTVPKQPDLIRLEIVKNKHGPKRLHLEKNAIYLELERETQTLRERDAPADDDTSKDEERQSAEAARAGRVSEQARADAAVLAIELARSPGLGTRDLRAACRLAAALSVPRLDAACQVLGAALVRSKGERGAVAHHLDGSKVPDEVLRLVQGEARPKVLGARPPADPTAGEERGTPDA